VQLIDKLQNLGFILRAPAPISMDDKLTIEVVHTRQEEPEIEALLKKELEYLSGKN